MCEPYTYGLVWFVVSKAIMHNIWDMDIDLIEYERMHLLAIVYNSTALEVLWLHFYFALSNPLDGVCFPNLKILHIFMHHIENQVIKKLFFSCHSLTKLDTMVFILSHNPPTNFIIQSTTLNMLKFVVLFAQLWGKLYYHHTVIRALITLELS